MQFDVDLTPLTTFQTKSRAEAFCAVDSVEALANALSEAKAKGMSVNLLGGGANTIARAWVKGLTLKVAIPGVTVDVDDQNVCRVTVGAGETIDTVIGELVEKNLGGLENLSSIPGTVGGAIVQNIGAYGVEIGPFVETVTVYDMEEGRLLTLTQAECRFGYRHSVFKTPQGAGLVIVSVTLNLGNPKDWRPTVSYRAVEDALAHEENPTLTPAFMRRLIQGIRARKLPDPRVIGNAGSFFTNPVITTVHWRELISVHPNLPWYDLDDDHKKLAAAGLIEAAGFKGEGTENVGTYPHHALILVNRGGATGEDVERFAETIVERVEALFGVRLEAEPVFLG